MTHRFIPKDSKRVLAITERDLLLIATVAEYRLIQSDQLLALSGGNEGVRKRISQLFHSGYLGKSERVKHLVRGRGNVRDVFMVTGKGLEVLQDNGIDVTGYAPKTADLQLGHRLMIARGRFALEVALRGKPIDAEVIDGDHYQGVEENKPSYIPDLVTLLTFTDRPAPNRLALMWEFHHRANRQQFKRKMEAYLLSFETKEHEKYYGVPSFYVATVTTTPERCANLVQELRKHADKRGVRADARRHFLFTSEDRFTGEPSHIVGQVWQNLGGQADSLFPSPRPS